MITVVNTKTNAPSGNDVFIGRGSALGNPYTHLPIEKRRLISKSQAGKNLFACFVRILEKFFKPKMVQPNYLG